MFHNRFIGLLTGQSKVIPHNDVPGFYTYQTGLLFTPGAERNAFLRPFNDPLQWPWKGSGAFAGSLGLIQTPQVYQNFVAPVNPLWGVPVGSYDLQGLSANTGVASGAAQ